MVKPSYSEYRLFRWNVAFSTWASALKSVLVLEMSCDFVKITFKSSWLMISVFVGNVPKGLSIPNFFHCWCFSWNGTTHRRCFCGWYQASVPYNSTLLTSVWNKRRFVFVTMLYPSLNIFLCTVFYVDKATKVGIFGNIIFENCIFLRFVHHL